MKAPTEKRNDTIQIMVTRSCNLMTCSNCTQVLPFRRDALHMSPEVFREAVASVVEWPGIVAMFGGNPPSHPKFPELCRILSERIPPERRGLWASGFGGHGKLIFETFRHGRLNLNAHGNAALYDEMDRWLPGRVIKESRDTPSMHAAIIVNRADLGISDEEWIEARESCEINAKWSAAIAERDGRAYAYFCEVAAALDGIRTENNGIPAVPGWWRSKMSAFENQVSMCCDRGCGVPLRLVGRPDIDKTYDMTLSWYREIRRLPEPKAAGIVDVNIERDTRHATAIELTDYLRRRTKWAHRSRKD